MIGQYLMFNQDCSEAIKVYTTVFDVKTLEIQKYGDMPPNPAFAIPDSDKDLVLHARLQLEGMEIMCADSSERSRSGNNMYITITTKDMAMVQKAWEVLKQDGEIYMELAASFFAVLHGSLQDKFGINWMFTVLK